MCAFFKLTFSSVCVPGRDDGTFYLIKNCRLFEAQSTSYCYGSSNTWLAYAKTANETLRRIYVLEPSTGLIGDQVGSDTATYDPRLRFWWAPAVAADGAPIWTNYSASFASGGAGYTYARTFAG